MVGLTVHVLRDQHNGFHFRFVQGTAAVTLAAAAIGDISTLGVALERGGILALTRGSRAYAQALAQAADRETAEPCYLVSRPGYAAGVFVLPDGVVVGRCTGGELLVQLENPVGLSRAGSFAEWRRAVRRFGRGQSYVVFALSLAFVGMILDLAAHDGAVLIELAGQTSMGKTSLLRLAASVWGAPSRAGSIAAAWRFSGPGLQHLMFARSSAFLPLDEVNTAGVSAARQREVLGDAAFFLEAGESAVHDRARAVQHARTCMLSTANESADGVLAGLGRDRADAAAVRVIAVPIDAGAGLGFWSRLPRGYLDGGAAAEALLAAVGADHGWAAARFANRLARDRRRDELALRGQIAGYIAQFMAGLELPPGDGAARRRATKFAITYAAGQLAADWGVLPFRRVEEAVRAVYDRAAPDTPTVPPGRRSAMDRVRAHLAAHRSEIVDLDHQQRPRLRAAELEASPGWLRTVSGRPCLVMRGAAIRRLFGSDQGAAKRELGAEERLVRAPNEPFQNQVPVRQGEDKTRVYAIDLS